MGVATIVAGVSERKSMDRWLGDGGMAIIGAIGGTFERYGVDGEDLGWVTGSFTPTQLALEPSESPPPRSNYPQPWHCPEH